MKMPFLRGREFAIEPLSLEDARLLPAIHREDFQRAWSGQEFETLIAQEPVFGYAAWSVGRRADGPLGFVLARLAAGEAEILTIAVLRACRKRGLGRELMEAVLRELHVQRAEALLLEVDEANDAAIGLYRKLGFREIARRPGYYGEVSERKSDALVMRRDLR